MKKFYLRFPDKAALQYRLGFIKPGLQRAVLLLSLIISLSSFWLCAVAQVQPPTSYTNVYNAKTYTSPRPFNVNVIYFVPKDVAFDPTYLTRLSAVLLAGQEFYKQNMINNGYGAKTFGLLTEENNPNNVKIILINAEDSLKAYPSGADDKIFAQVTKYFVDNPSQRTSEHTLILTAVPSLDNAHVPYYGTGKTCYALDYPGFDIKDIGKPTEAGRLFTTYYGGIMHELGHALNLPHSAGTKTETGLYGTNLMADGNYTLGLTPTFLNRASCAILTNCQVFADAPGNIYYDGVASGLTKLKTEFINGELIVSGTFYSNRIVTAVNIYQDPFATPSQGYARVAWSVDPVDKTFIVRMPVSELNSTDGPYNLEIELIQKNGDQTFDYYPFHYTNGVPNINIDFDDNAPCDMLPTGWQLTKIGTAPIPGIACYTAATDNYRLRNYNKNPTEASDILPFVHTSLTGDGRIIARVKDVSSTYNTSGGIMLRNTLDTTSNFVFLNALDTRGVFDLYRTRSGQNTNYYAVDSFPVPMWLKLERKGNQVTSYYSGNGIDWTLYHNFNVNFNQTIYAGIAAFGEGAATNIDNVSVLECPRITSQPIAQSACVGGEVRFSVGSSNTGGSYQWLMNGVPLDSDHTDANGSYAGSTTNTLTLTPKNKVYNGATFSVRIMDSFCTVTSDSAQLTLYATGSCVSLQGTLIKVGGSSTK